MKFAAVADIHGNALALEAVLADIDALGIADVVNLGDCFSGPLEAGRCADLLMTRNFSTVRGNHDRWLLEKQPPEMGPSDRAAFEQLGEAHLQWLAGLPSTLVYRDGILLCHATPENDNKYWLEAISADGIVHAAPIEAVEREAAGIDFSLILCGHTHLPRMVRLRDGRTVVNPGSVGCPGFEDIEPVRHIVEAGHPNACYAVIEWADGAWRVEFRFVAYDHMAMSALAAKNGRPEWASALATGWVR
jgi:diadenosine tetraphosphatase ApaH/serine/threonine PP2A family protein phosphatase